jgi:hypothetical protein
MTAASQQTLQDIYRVKHAVLLLRRAVSPLRKVVTAMQHSDSTRFAPTCVRLINMG